MNGRTGRTKVGKSIVFDVWLPGTHPRTHASMLTLKNGAMLRFFLEALVRGHSMFFGQRFDVVASYGDVSQPLGSGIYTVQYVDETGKSVELVTHLEEGTLHNFMQLSWYDMMQCVMNRTCNISLDDVL